MYQIRSGKEQYKILLKTLKGDQSEQPDASDFSCFDAIEPLQFNPFTEPVWQDALQQYNSSMSHTDARTADILKIHLRQAQSNPRQLLAEFLRYSDLIRREKVRNELTSEREILVGQLETFCRQMNEELTTYLKSAKNTPTGKNMSNTLKTIIWITQGENTVSYTWHIFLTRGVGFFVKERENAEKKNFLKLLFFSEEEFVDFWAEKKSKVKRRKVAKK